MKRYFQWVLLGVLLSSIHLNAQNLLNGPECVVYDSVNSRYLVSNWNDGKIVAIDSNGNQSYFKQRTGHALGNCIVGDTFYVSIGTAILGLNLNNPEDTVMYLPVSGTTQMDGMAADDNNNLYVLASIQARLIKINLSNHSYSVFVGSGISARPQDVIFDKKHNRLLICSWYNNPPIQAVDLADSSISDIVLTPNGNCDGLALDDNGNCYYSSWASNAIHTYDSTFTNPPVLFSSGHSGPSNICFNAKDNEIAIPCFNTNRLNLIPVIPVQIKEVDAVPTGFALMQNYPNPFNPTTKIEFRIAKFAFVTLKVYDILGSEVATPVDGFMPAGSHKVEFDAHLLPSGIYFYQLKQDNNTLTKKMMLIR